MASASRSEKALKQVYELVHRRVRREIRSLQCTSAETAGSSSWIPTGGASGSKDIGINSSTSDQWRFLENPNSALARTIVQAELSWHDEVLSDTGNDDVKQHDAWVRYLYHEASGLLADEPPETPEIFREYAYFQETSEQGFPMFYRQKIICKTAEKLQFAAGPELMLDITNLARDSGYAEVPVCKMSDDSSALAYVVDLVGDESYTLRFRSPYKPNPRVKIDRAGKEWQEWPLVIPMVRNAEWVTFHSEVQNHSLEQRLSGKFASESAQNNDFQSDNGHAVVYVQMDSTTKRGARVLAARINQISGNVLEEVELANSPDEAVYMDVFKSKDGKMLFISANTKSTAEVRVLPLPIPWGMKPKLLRSKIPNVEYFCEHHEGFFYVMTNEFRHDFQVLAIPVSDVFNSETRTNRIADEKFSSGDKHSAERSLEGGHDVGPARDNFFEVFTPDQFKISDADMFSKGLVLYGWSSIACPHICYLPLPESREKLAGGSGPARATFLPLARAQSVSEHNKTDGIHGKYIEPRLTTRFPATGPIGVIESLVNADYHRSKVRFVMRSPLHPGTDFEYDLNTQALTRLRERSFGADLSHHASSGSARSRSFDRSQFSLRMISAPASDGAFIPITIVEPKGAVSTTGEVSPTPCLLQVYGAYGTLLQPEFHLDHILLLRRGWRIAWAHVRGGAEKGLNWHLSAKGAERRHVSGRDLLDCARFLIGSNYTSSHLMVAKGSSAGGAILGWALNQEPHLFAGAVLSVPFLDTVGGMRDPTLPLAVHEYEEWGNPNLVDDLCLMQSFNPFDNISENKPWPPTYLLSSGQDARVPPWQALKTVAKLRSMKDRPPESIVLKISGAGHLGIGASAYDGFAESCREVSFMLRVVGFENPTQITSPIREGDDDFD